jgi:hypothetical protein
MTDLVVLQFEEEHSCLLLSRPTAMTVEPRGQRRNNSWTEAPRLRLIDAREYPFAEKRVVLCLHPEPQIFRAADRLHLPHDLFRQAA